MYSNFLVQNLLQNSRIQGYTFLSKLLVVPHAQWQRFQQEDQTHPSPWDELPLKRVTMMIKSSFLKALSIQHSVHYTHYVSIYRTCIPTVNKTWSFKFRVDIHACNKI